MACINCLQNCGGDIVSDQCVEYTGDPIPALGICTGDQLSSVEAAIVNALLTSLDGTGISPANVTVANCAWLQQQFVGQNPTLAAFLQLLINGECSLYSMIEQINTALATVPTFNTGCLQGLPSSPTPNQILQALVTDYCTTKALVSAIPSTYVQLSSLTGLVTQILENLGLIGNSTQIQYAQYMPIGMAFPYFGSLANFDLTGKGLSAAGFAGLQLMNGSNSSIDARGRTFVGAIANVPGGTLASAVDPTKPFNPNTNWSVGQAFGENYHILTTTEIPSHNHGVNDPGHTHSVTLFLDLKCGSCGTKLYSSVNNNQGSGSFTTASATTGITIQSAGGGSFHNNVQPSLATYWVIRVS